MFIGLNPSTADANRDDPTIRRCMGFAIDWGYCQLTVVNLFAYRTPYPKLLHQTAYPEGKRNRAVLNKVCCSADRIVAAWGTHGQIQHKAATLNTLWTKHELFCFGETVNQQPLHPLYQPKTAKLKRYYPTAI